jgi:hypothetical protein
MIPKAAHQLEDLPQPLFVGNVITDQVRTAHGAMTPYSIGVVIRMT